MDRLLAAIHCAEGRPTPGGVSFTRTGSTRCLGSCRTPGPTPLPTRGLSTEILPARDRKHYQGPRFTSFSSQELFYLILKLATQYTTVLGAPGITFGSFSGKRTAQGRMFSTGALETNITPARRARAFRNSVWTMSMTLIRDVRETPNSVLTINYDSDWGSRAPNLALTMRVTLIGGVRETPSSVCALVGA
jgi:hypothetical protein